MRRAARRAPSCRYHTELTVCDQCVPPERLGANGFPRVRGRGSYRLCPGCRRLYDLETWGEWHGAVLSEMCAGCCLTAEMIRDWAPPPAELLPPARTTHPPAPPEAAQPRPSSPGARVWELSWLAVRNALRLLAS